MIDYTLCYFACKSKNNYFLPNLLGRGQILQRNHTQSLVAMDTTAIDVSGAPGRRAHPQPAVLRGQGVPPGRVLPHQDPLPHAQDGAEREV